MLCISDFRLLELNRYPKLSDEASPLKTSYKSHWKNGKYPMLLGALKIAQNTYSSKKKQLINTSTVL